MTLIKNKLILFPFIFLFFANTFSQCGVTETVTICDMTTLDFDNDGNPDGIINLYDSYNAIPGVTPISNTTGAWFDPNYNFALDELNGDLHVWDLLESSTDETNYQFQLLDSSSGCTDNLMVTLTIVIGPFSGIADITSSNEGCDPIEYDPDTYLYECFTTSFFDLFQTFESIPHPHTNGEWSYNGSSPNFIGIDENILLVNIPYQEGAPLVDSEVFELTYTVPGILPCTESISTTITVSIIRGVFSGAANKINICENQLIDGTYGIVDLRDNAFLVDEDSEGKWTDINNTGQISNPIDSEVNLEEIYQNLIAINPRFKCETYNFVYTVESRATVCSSSTSTVTLRFFESIRPFEQNEIPEFCVRDETLSSINLYDYIEFSEENGVVYDYALDEHTNWSFISGPSNLGLETNTSANYSHLGTLNLSDITDANAGTYKFRYTVDSNYNCEISDEEFNDNGTFIYNSPCQLIRDYSDPCNGQSGIITIVIHPYNYPGENTSVELCESDISNPINLTNLLETNGVDNLYLGPDSHWYNLDTDETVSNPFVFPEIDGEQTFNLQYRITANDCEEQANLTLKINEQYKAGLNAVVDVCVEDTNFELFDSLNGAPDDNGSWEGPDGFTGTSSLVDFNPGTFETGEYIYTVPSNGNCDERSATVMVNIHPLSNAGDNVEEIVCKLDNHVDLLDLLDSDADSGGTFIDLDNTNALSGSIVDLSLLSDNSYSFQYDVQPNAACVLASSVITLVVNDVPIPIVSDQSFCMGYGATVADLEVSSNQDNYNWYADNTDTTTLDTDLILQNGEDYFVTAVNENDCESERVKVTVTLIEFGQEGCVSCVNDGVSANGDNENDSLGICDLPSVFPNFDIKIFNRYGNIIYAGNINTPLFDGTSNVSLTLGDQVPAGVYFYIFSPNDGVTKPFQGDFYLSR